MSLDRASRQERKLKAVLWAQHRLKQRIQTIDWIEDELQPRVEALKSGKTFDGIPGGAAFDIRVIDGDADRNSLPPTNPEE